LVKHLDGASDLVFAVGGQPLVSEHAQFDQIATLFLEERQLLTFLDEVRAGQAGRAVVARQECAKPTPANAKINPKGFPPCRGCS